MEPKSSRISCREVGPQWADMLRRPCEKMALEVVGDLADRSTDLGRKGLGEDGTHAAHVRKIKPQHPNEEKTTLKPKMVEVASSIVEIKKTDQQDEIGSLVHVQASPKPKD